MAAYDALIVVSFGGPEGPDDVIPFLENVTRGRGIPPERLAEAGRHYELFGGVSPINGQNRLLVAAVEEELARRALDLPVYWGNRNWHPLLPDAVAAMAADGVRRALAFVTSAFGSFSGCRQYLDDIERARAAVGPDAPTIDKLRLFFDHPRFVEPWVQAVGAAAVAAAGPAARLVFTAHSIPAPMAAATPYVDQLRETCRLVTERLPPDAVADWELAYQSRSGAPGQPWLEPDITEVLTRLAGEGAGDVVVAPIGFVSDHMEVVYDLDTQARAVANGLGLRLHRAATPGVALAPMVVDLVVERLTNAAERPALSALGPWPDHCPAGHCVPAPQAGFGRAEPRPPA